MVGQGDKSQAGEIWCLSALLERQQTILEKVQEQQSNIQEMPLPWHPTSHLKELQKETFNVLPGTVNARWDTGVAHTSRMSQCIPVTSSAFFEDELADKVTWASQNHLCHVHFAANPKGAFTSTPQKLTETRKLRSYPLNNKVTVKWLLPYIHKDMRCKWWHRCSASCTNPKLIS